MRFHLDKNLINQWIEGKLKRHFGKEPDEASAEQLFTVCAYIARDLLMEYWVDTQDVLERRQGKRVYYLSMEFLIGKSLKNELFNLGVTDLFESVLKENYGIRLDELFDVEKDAALGNGGLGRLAACFMSALTTRDYPAMGFTILYEYGVFRQRILEGMQVELPDNWLETGDVWIIPKIDETQEVRFNGIVDTVYDNGRLKFIHKDYATVLAVANDMLVSGYRSKTVNNLRLWSAKSTQTIDMALFSKGEYAKSMEQKAISEVISKVLYPEDNHTEGKSLRLKQQYFFVSATIQSIIKKHKSQYKTLSNLHEKVVIHINDTHPALAIPELMRILIDEEDYEWEAAWRITTSCIAYTNHTVLYEALERWTVDLFKRLLPRVYMIVEEISRRFCEKLNEVFPNERDRVSKLAIVANEEIRMANLCVASCFSVNGVSALHSNIIKNHVFRDFGVIFPGKFKNVTNGIEHRRWLCQANPKLAALIRELIGDGFYKEPEKLRDLLNFTGDKTVLEALERIKRENKKRLLEKVLIRQHHDVDLNSVFDVQAKRLHEYKRQLLNVLHIMYEYHQILDFPSGDYLPKTYIFGAKAAAGYYMAKRIIRLIHSVASEINSNPDVKNLIKLVFLEDYKVSAAEILMPAAEVSEQISIAGKEASGTGNMKFMLNGALTIGTLDGANVEIYELVGDENIYIFGLKSHEVEKLNQNESYVPSSYYQDNPSLRRVLDHLRDGVGVGTLRAEFSDIVNSLLFADTYMLLADFDDYCRAHRCIERDYSDSLVWNRKSLINIAHAGWFSADRSVAEYSDNIWNLSRLDGEIL